MGRREGPYLMAEISASGRARADSYQGLLRRGLLYCMEYLEESLGDWLGEELQVIRAYPCH